MGYAVRATCELYHHGITGQKWGVRRFQNEDGSYKPAGEKRYGIGDGESYDGVHASGGSKKSSGGSESSIPSGTVSKSDTGLSDKERYKLEKQRINSEYAKTTRELDPNNKEHNQKYEEAADKWIDDHNAAKARYKASREATAREWQQHRKARLENETVGKSIGKFLLMGGTGTYTYNSLRANGDSRGAAFAKQYVAGVLGSTVGGHVAGTKGRLIGQAAGHMALAKHESNKYRREASRRY